MSLENRLSQLENLVRTVAYENRIVTREELLQGINQVSIQELIHTSYSILNNRDATPTIVMVGADLKTVPSYEKLLEIYLEEKRAATSC